MADVKTLLKEARKLIDDKNYKEAVECCKNILKKDKQNYLALVLLGKSLQDSDQAPLAFQKAIANKPEYPLAWQGLANYYERKDKNSDKIKLFTVYDEILKLQIDSDKTIEIITKLCELGCSLKNSDSISTLITFINNSNDGDLKKEAEKQFLELLKADVPCKEADIPLTLNILNKLCKNDTDDHLKVLYAKIILQKSTFASAVEKVIELPFFSQNAVLREWLCKYLCKNYVEKASFCNFEIERYFDKITNGIENSKYPRLLKSMIYYDKSLFLDAYKQCVPLINYEEADSTEVTFILKCTIMLKKWSVAQKLAVNFLTKVKDHNFAVYLRKVLFFSLAKQQKWKQAVSAAKDIPFETLSVSEQASLTECYIEIEESAEHLIENLQSTEYYIQLKALMLLKQEKYIQAINLLEESLDNTNAMHLFYLGKAYWNQKQFENCHITLLKAAKLDSEHADTFLYLGHFYHYHKQDFLKAKKCYEKAYSLNAIDSNIVKELSEIYIKLGLDQTDFELLSMVDKNLRNNNWINFRLGLHYLKRKDWEKAIVEFRSVIKNNHCDITALECLADAYYSRGSFTSALRAYNKVIALNPNKTSHSLTKIGYIYLLITQYEDAISTFNKVLKIDPSSLLALKGIAETWIKIAKKKVTAKMFGSARDCAQYAVDYITSALSKQKDFLCLWKILADILIFVTKLPSKYAYVYMNNTFNITRQEVIKKEIQDLFQQAIACYSHMIKQKQQNASYDLASTYLAFYHKTQDQVNCHISFNLAITCIKGKPSLWRYWNLLGKICLFLKKYDIAQHCFIKALLVTRKWSVAKIWCNLGTLYLKLKHYKLANYCFWRGQSNLPSYALSWIGQGLIAEVIREEEAMDLFRHASRLGYHPESALGYADWVCRTLRNNKEDPEFKYVINGLYAIPYAIDLVEWFSSFEPNDACACTILGILQERAGLLRAAFKSYEKALQFAEEDKKNITRLNMGRILLRTEKYDEAIKVYKSITEASMNSTSGLALALFKKGLYEESYSAYDTALHWLSNDDNEKADLLVAMAGIIYMFKGADDAKTLLFHSIQISQKKPTAYSLFAICSLGLLHSDQSLSKLALSELQKYERDSKFGYDIGFLKSYIAYENDIEKAIKILSDSLHDHPSNAFLWFCVAQYCLSSSSMKASIASSCAQRALCLAHYNEFDCNPSKMIATASIAEHIVGDHGKALLLAKKGLHIYPNQPEIWAALLFSLLSHKLWENRKNWIIAVAGYMRRHLDISRLLSRWVSVIEKKLRN